MATWIENHYTANYFNLFQKEIGEFGSRANKFMFEEHVSPNHVVLDFGCGGGSLLNGLTAREKIGVELNPCAREYCSNVYGITCHESLDDVQDESIDVVISSHCLEHTTNPYELISTLYKKLKPGGKIVIVVPVESYRFEWTPSSLDKHLYSFSPMNLGNILQGIGFSCIRTEAILHKWIPFYSEVTKYFGFKVFDKLSWVYGWLAQKRVQVRGIAIKPL